MHSGKASGEDMFMAEYLKLAGPSLRQRVFDIVLKCWNTAAEAADQEQALAWPAAWTNGIIIPLWKKKGDRQNKNTWRGIALLSVGSKIVARICALRFSRWIAPWLNPLQFGFRPGCGVDDIQQISRRLIEEAAQSSHANTFLFRFYDLEKAYPKAVRHGLWQLLRRKGCPSRFINILQAIHDNTSSKVRFLGFESSTFSPDRGLREGCSSSPVLFNIYHSGILEVFRKRRTRAAEEAGTTAGIQWSYKVDGRVAKRKNDRGDEGRRKKTIKLGDMSYADDAAIFGTEQKVLRAEPLLIRTISKHVVRTQLRMHDHVGRWLSLFPSIYRIL